MKQNQLIALLVFFLVELNFNDAKKMMPSITTSTTTCAPPPFDISAELQTIRSGTNSRLKPCISLNYMKISSDTFIFDLSQQTELSKFLKTTTATMTTTSDSTATGELQNTQKTTAQLKIESVESSSVVYPCLPANVKRDVMTSWILTMAQTPASTTGSPTGTATTTNEACLYLYE